MRWIVYFDNVNAILFVSDISAYDQFLVEDCNINRVKDSLELFKRICDMKSLEACSIILFLNKVDRFETKIKKIAIEPHFPEYTGIKYITRKVWE